MGTTIWVSSRTRITCMTSKNDLNCKCLVWSKLLLYGHLSRLTGHWEMCHPPLLITSSPLELHLSHCWHSSMHLPLSQHGQSRAAQLLFSTKMTILVFVTLLQHHWSQSKLYLTPRVGFSTFLRHLSFPQTANKTLSGLLKKSVNTQQSLYSTRAGQCQGNVYFYWKKSFNYNLGFKFLKTDNYSNRKHGSAIDFLLKIRSLSLKNMLFIKWFL